MRQIIYMFGLFLLGCMNANIEESSILAEVSCERINFTRNGQTIKDSLGHFSLKVDTNQWKVQKIVERKRSSVIIGMEDNDDVPTILISSAPLIGDWNLQDEISDLSYQVDIVDNGLVRLNNLGSFYWFRLREQDPFMEFLYLVEPDTINRQLFSIVLSTLDESKSGIRLCELEGIIVGLKKIK